MKNTRSRRKFNSVQNKHSKDLTFYINIINLILALITAIASCSYKNIPYKGLQLFATIILLVGSITGINSKKKNLSGIISAIFYVIFIFSQLILSLLLKDKKKSDYLYIYIYFSCCALISIINYIKYNSIKLSDIKKIIIKPKKTNNTLKPYKKTSFNNLNITSNSTQSDLSTEPNHLKFSNNDFSDYYYDNMQNLQQTSQENTAVVRPIKSYIELDELFYEAACFVIEKQKASTNMLQRVFRIGFNRAERIMNQLYEAGIVGPEEGIKTRRVLWNSLNPESEKYLHNYINESNKLKYTNNDFSDYYFDNMQNFQQTPQENTVVVQPSTTYSELDELFIEAARFVIEKQKASTALIQRVFRIGFNRATRIIDQLYEAGIVGPEEGSKPRIVLWNSLNPELEEHLHNYINKSNKQISSVKQPDYTTSNQRNTDFDNMDGHTFEYFCAELLKGNGFKNVKVTQASGDDGIDILAEKDDISYGIQCKCYSDNIGNKAVQEAYTGKKLYHVDIGVILTNRYFTDSAINTAKKTRIKLWDRKKLLELIDNKQ